VTEYDPVCQEVLVNSKTKPHHCFSNILDRVPKAVTKYLDECQQHHRSALQDSGEPVGSRKYRQLIKDHGEDFLEEACSYLEHIDFPKDAVAQCRICNQDCPLWPVLDENCVWIEIAGNTCTPWSSVGKGLGWLDTLSIPCLIWAFTSRWQLPHHIVNECTSAWPAKSFFHKVFGGLYDISSISMSPDDLGLPATRNRTYTHLSCKSLCCPIVQLTSAEFNDIYRRDLVVDALDFWSAPKSLVKAAHRDLVKKRKIVGGLGLDRLPWHEIMPVGLKKRWFSYKKLHDETIASGSGGHAAICNLAWNSSYFGSPRSLMPALLTKSVIYSFAAKRPLLACEHFVVHGIPLFRGSDVVDDDLFLNLGLKRQRRLSGNQTVVQVVGTVVGLIMLGHRSR